MKKHEYVRPYVKKENKNLRLITRPLKLSSKAINEGERLHEALADKPTNKELRSIVIDLCNWD